MRGEDFFKIIDGIDDDIILDVPELNTQKPTKVEVGHRKPPISAIALSAACLVLVLVMGVFIASKLHNDQIISADDPNYPNDPAENYQSSDNSGDQSSDPDESEFVLDKNILDRVRLVRGRSDLELLGATPGMECKELLAVNSPSGYSPGIRGIYAADTGIVIWANYESYDHYFRLDNDNVETDHVAFNINDTKELIPDREYPNGGYFTGTSEDGTRELLYYKNGRLQSTAPLPEVYRASFTPDHSQYLYIDPDRENLVLYDLETETDVKVLSVTDLGYDDNWVFAFANAVTSELATVTLLDADPNTASEYNGSENLRSFLLELPSLHIIQELPYSTELMALDDENFIMTKKYDNAYRQVSRVVLINGKLVEPADMNTKFIIKESSQYNNPSNIIFSPSKKVMLVRYWDDYGYLECEAVSTDTMRKIRGFSLESGETILAGLYRPAAITDDAVIYMFGDTLIDGDDKPLYIFELNDQDEPPTDDIERRNNNEPK